jgi:outer membrane protein TolC
VKKLLLILTLLFILTTTSISAVSENPQSVKLKAEKSSQRVQITAKISEKRRALIRAYFEQMGRRIEAAISRLERLIVRIQSRLVKLEVEGKDVADEESQLNQARNELSKAKADFTAAKAEIEQMVSSDNPKENFSLVRNLIKEVKTKLIIVHRLLVHIIGDIATPTPIP